MTEIIEFYRSCGSGWTLRCAALACFVLLSGAFSVRPQEQTDTLKVGQPIAREMRGGEQQMFLLTLKAGHYARLSVEQKGIDIVFALHDADGKPLVEVDNNLSGTRGPEIISLIADVSRAYIFSVRSLEKGASPGRYELRIEEVRPAIEQDRTRVDAERSYLTAAKLQAARTGESLRKANERYTEALRLMREAGDRRGEAMTLTNMGDIYNVISEPQKAIEHLDLALSVWQAIGDRHLEAITLSIKAGVYNRRGEPQKALDSYSVALPVMRAVGDQGGEAFMSIQIGSVYRSLGEPQKALDYYAHALRLLRALGDSRNQPTLLNNIGTVYTLLGDTQKALNYFEEVLPLVRAKNDRRTEAAVLTNMGTVYNLQNDSEKALEYLDQALAVVRANKDRRTEAAVLTHMATAYSTSGAQEKAVEYFERGLEMRVAVSDRLGEATTLNHYGRALALWKQPQKALDQYQKALPIWSAVGDRNGEAAALYGMARAESDLGNLAGANARTEAALGIINALRTKVASRYLRASYFASVQDIYKLHIDVLMRRHQREPGAGFDVAAWKAYEQARARSLIDMLAEASADIRQGVNPELLARERSLQQMLNAEAERQMRMFGGQPKEEEVSAVRRKIEDLLNQLLAIEADLKAQSPRYAALTQPAPLGLAEIQSAVIDDSTLLLEYSLGDERSYLWAVTAKSFSSYELPSRAVIEAAARRCYELLTARNLHVKFETAEEKRERVRQADAEYPQAAAALSKMLLGPVAAELKQKRLLVVPDGALEYLPFAALTIPGRTATAHPQGARRSQPAPYVPLIVEHEVTSIPSASTLAVLRRELHERVAAEKVVAVFADPVFEKTDERITGESSSSARRAQSATRSAEMFEVAGAQESMQYADGPPRLQRLPYTRQEADAILTLAPPAGRKAALGFEANREAAMSDDLINYRIIHFATHSILDSEHPELSGIALSMLDRQGRSQNGFLRAHEVFNLRLGADLVVLSGCRTGLGKEIKGEGLYGMTRGFMYAGSKRVLVSLWDVQDQATARLMSDFYRGLLGPKRPNTAAALRAAQIATWREGRWQAPYYWAAFVLQGEPR